MRSLGFPNQAHLGPNLRGYFVWFRLHFRRPAGVLFSVLCFSHDLSDASVPAQTIPTGTDLYDGLEPMRSLKQDQRSRQRVPGAPADRDADRQPG
jgi:hypothetical protein